MCWLPLFQKIRLCNKFSCKIYLENRARSFVDILNTSISDEIFMVIYNEPYPPISLPESGDRKCILVSEQHGKHRGMSFSLMCGTPVNVMNVHQTNGLC